MKAEVNREELCDLIKQRIEFVKQKPKSVQKEVEDYMAKQYNVKYAVTVDIFNYVRPLEAISDDLLFKLISSMYNVLLDKWEEYDSSDLIVSRYFTDVNIKQFNNPLGDSIYNEDIEFDRWYDMTEYHFKAKISLRDLVQKLRDFNKIRYNPATQRDFIISYSGGIPIKKTDLNIDAVNNIKKLVKKNEYFAPVLSLNINTDINIKSNQLLRIEGSKLILPKDAVIDIIDGFHNYTALCAAFDNDETIDFNVDLNIFMLDDEEANKFILQMDYKNHLRKTQARRINKDNDANFIVKKLNSLNDSNLKGKLIRDNYDDVLMLITEIFNPQKREESVIIYPLIMNNMNELIERNMLFNHNFTLPEWFVYLYLIKKSNNMNLNFMNLVNQLNIDSLVEQITIVNKPQKKHYLLVDNSVEEVKSNVL